DDGAASPALPGGITVGAGNRTIEATRCFVGFAADADHLLVPGTTPDGVRIALVPASHPTVRRRRHEELGRGEVYHVRFARTPVTAWLGDAEDWAAVLATARIRHASYLVGLAQGVLDLTVAYARQRHQFGQPIGRFQAIAFRLSSLTARVDAARLLTVDAARLADSGGDPRYAASGCLALAAELARTTTTEALQVHGASGMLERNDPQLFYRRAAVDAMWLGTPTQLRTEAVPLIRNRLNGDAA
ncbi:MAG: acyl-CoA dehydrogenase family protein, partial [Micromonosporaceae bacterium]